MVDRKSYHFVYSRHGFRLHGNPLGDVGIEKLVAGLEERHLAGQIPEEAVRMAAKDVAGNILNDTLQSSSLGSVVTQVSKANFLAW